MNQLPLALEIIRAEHKALILDALKGHRGAASGINVKALALRTLMTERAVRQAVSDLDVEGIAVCAHPAHGYFIADSAEELEMCIEFLRSRAMHGLKRAARLSGVALPAYLGQLQLREIQESPHG
jgi:hypothetical protein